MKTESITLSSGLQVNRTITKRCGHNVTIITTGAIKKHSHANLIIKRIRNIFFANYKKLALIMILIILNKVVVIQTQHSLVQRIQTL